MLPTAQWVLPAAYTLLTVAQPHLIYDRLDIVLLMFFLLCIECHLRSLENSAANFGKLSRARNRRAELWGMASYLFLGLGISFKIMPVIFVPFLLLADLCAAGSAGDSPGGFWLWRSERWDRFWSTFHRRAGTCFCCFAIIPGAAFIWNRFGEASCCWRQRSGCRARWSLRRPPTT